MSGEAGKGDTYRKVDAVKYSTNYEQIFGKKQKISEQPLEKEGVDKPETDVLVDKDTDSW